VPSLEIMERRRLFRELDRLCVKMDLDALRFVVCVAHIRIMTDEELERFHKEILAEKKKRGKE
jgi:hypothetical protein